MNLDFKIKNYKATSPGIRGRITIKDFTLDKKKNKFFFRNLKRNKFCNSKGNLVNYHKSFGKKKLYRLIDFKRTFYDFKAIIINFEYDPNRNAVLALLQFENNTFSYILKNDDMKIGDVIYSFSNKPLNFSIGNKMKLEFIPVGMVISNISSNYNKNKAVYLRSAGSFGQIISKKNGNCLVLFNSGEKKIFSLDCIATIGLVSGIYNKFKNLGKAGASRWLGNRPRVRGVAMNPIDHPHGGGNGKTSGGRPSVSRWGKYTK